MEKYGGYILFECTLHIFFIYHSDDQGTTMALLPLCITEDVIQQGMVKWLAHIQPLPAEKNMILETHNKHNQYQKKAKSM